MLNTQTFPQLLTRINDLLYEESDTYQFKPMDRLSARARRNALEKLAPDCPVSRALALWDTTVFSSGKDGFLLATDGLYGSVFRRFQSGLPTPGKIHFQGLTAVEEDEDRRSHIRVTYTDGSTYSVFASIYTPAVFWVLDSVLAALRAEASTPAPTVPVTEPPRPMEKPAAPQPTPTPQPAKSAPTPKAVAGTSCTGGKATPVPKPSALLTKERLHHLLYDINDMLDRKSILYCFHPFDEITVATRTLAMANIARGCKPDRAVALWDTAEWIPGKEGFVLATDGLYGSYFRENSDRKHSDHISFDGMVFAAVDDRSDSYVRVFYEDGSSTTFYACIYAKQVAEVLRLILDEYARLLPPVTITAQEDIGRSMPLFAEALLRRPPRVNWVQTIPDPMGIIPVSLQNCRNPEQTQTQYTEGYERFREWVVGGCKLGDPFPFLDLWKQAAQDKLPEAVAALGIFELHHCRKKDPGRALDLYEAMDAAYGPFHMALGIWQGRLPELDFRYQEMFMGFRNGADSGNGNSALYTAYGYYHGLTEAPSREKAWQYLRLAAASGNRDAAVTLGSLYAAGLRPDADWPGIRNTLLFCTRIDRATAEPWEIDLLMAALEILMECFINQPDLQDLGDATNLNVALGLVNMAADYGHPAARRYNTLLADLLKHGRPDTPRHSAKAESYTMQTKKTREELLQLTVNYLISVSKPDFTRQVLESAAEDDPTLPEKDKAAYVHLCSRYLTDVAEGMQDRERRLLIALLQQNQSSFQPEVDNLLGILMLEEGGIANEKRAYAYFRAAADKGSARGMCNAAYCQQKGIGTRQDNNGAVKGLDKACDAGSRDACLLNARNMMAISRQSDEGDKYLALCLYYISNAAAYGDVFSALIVGELFRQNSAPTDNWLDVAATLVKYLVLGPTHAEPTEEDYLLWAAEILLECFIDNPRLQHAQLAAHVLDLIRPQFPALYAHYSSKLQDR